jgi:predicted ATPase
VLVVGEPGIGKSRLIEEFRSRLGETPHTWVEWSSSQLLQLQDTPLNPIAEWVGQPFGVDLPAERRLPDLEDTLRLVGLDPAEYTPFIGAVIGRDFSYELLASVAALSERGYHPGSGSVGGVADPALQSALDRLAEADIRIVGGVGRDATYRFKHALIQDAAYESLLRSSRQALHRQAAEILRDEPERAAAQPEIIAHHFTEAGLDDPAIEWWGKAGDRALRRSAFQEAIAHLGKAIVMADRAGTFSLPRAAARLLRKVSG